jgi:hypothetical protein
VTPSESRRFASGIALLLALAGAWAVVSGSGACVRTGASLGQSCLKDDDCFSGHCTAQICVRAAPELSADAAEGDSMVADSPGSADAPGTDDGPAEGSVGSTDGGSGDAVATDAEASVPADATDGPSGTDAADANGSTDAAGDGASSDAKLDSGAG